MALTLTTYTGRKIDPLNVKAGQLDIRDIAHALSMICRFGGHARQFYSVAEHSIRVSCLVPQEHALAALLHDAAEAYLGDVPRPLKGRFASFTQAEQKILAQVAGCFGFDFPLHACVHGADNSMLAAEMQELMEGGTNPAEISCLPPHLAEKAFLARFSSLQHQSVER